EVTTNKAQLLQIAAENLGATPGRILMADAVTAVTADTLRQPFVWPGVHVGSRLKRGMEGRVEYRDLRHVRTEYPIHGLDRFELQAIVRRRKFHLLSDRPA